MAATDDLQNWKPVLQSAPPAPAIPRAIAPAVGPSAAPQSGLGSSGLNQILGMVHQAGGLSPQEYTGAANSILQQIDAANAPAIKGIEGNMARREQIMGQPIARPAQPQYRDIPAAPKQEFRNPVQVFGNSATVLALLASAFTRRPLVTAINAASAAMDAYHQGDTERLKLEHQNWMDAVKQAIDQNQVETQKYSAAMQDTQMSLDERNAQLQALAASNNDQNMLAALRSARPDMAMKILDGRQAAADRLIQLYQTAQYRDEQLRLQQERIDLMAQGASGTLDQPTVDMIARQYLQGDSTALVGLGYGKQGAANRSAVLRRAAELAGGTADIAGSRADYAANKGTLKQMQNYISRADTFQEVFLKNITQVEKYAPAGVAGDYPVLNKWIQAGRRATGDADVAAFDAAIKTAAREYARIMSGPTSNAQLTVSAQANADEMLSSAMNADQLQAVITVMKQDIQNSIQSAQDTMDVLRSNISPQAPGSDVYRATMPDGRNITSDDGEVWHYDDGSPVE